VFKQQELTPYHGKTPSKESFNTAQDEKCSKEKG
jgi:hypothetical protein